MRDPFEQVHQFVDALLRVRRPRRFRVETAEDAGALRMAAALVAEGNPSGAEPDPTFVQRLRGRVAAASGRAPPTSRRSFLAAALAGLAAGLGGGFGLARFTQPAGSSVPTPQSGGIPIVRENGRWFPVARLSALAERATLRFTAGALEGHLVKRGNELTALSAICSHLPCTLVWRDADDDFLCPCHDATFHADGEQKFALRPYPPLTRFQAKVEGDQVFVWSIGEDGPRSSSKPS